MIDFRRHLLTILHPSLSVLCKISTPDWVILWGQKDKGQMKTEQCQYFWCYTQNLHSTSGFPLGNCKVQMTCLSFSRCSRARRMTAPTLRVWGRSDAEPRGPRNELGRRVGAPAPPAAETLTVRVARCHIATPIVTKTKAIKHNQSQWGNI